MSTSRSTAGGWVVALTEVRQVRHPSIDGAGGVARTAASHEMGSHNFPSTHLLSLSSPRHGNANLYNKALQFIRIPSQPRDPNQSVSQLFPHVAMAFYKNLESSLPARVTVSYAEVAASGPKQTPEEVSEAHRIASRNIPPPFPPTPLIDTLFAAGRDSSCSRWGRMTDT